jgi:hypothetical protein
VPRYYFDLVEGEKRKIDRAGVVVEDLQSAERAALESARDCMVTRLLEDKDPDEIVDAKGNLMSTVCFRDLLPSAVREAENE